MSKIGIQLTITLERCPRNQSVKFRGELPPRAEKWWFFSSCQTLVAIYSWHHCQETPLVQAISTFILNYIDSVIINFPLILTQNCCGKGIVIPGPSVLHFVCRIALLLLSMYFTFCKCHYPLKCRYTCHHIWPNQLNSPRTYFTSINRSLPNW